MVLAGARDLDPPEVAYLESSGIHRAEVVPGHDPDAWPRFKQAPEYYA